MVLSHSLASQDIPVPFFSSCVTPWGLRHLAVSVPSLRGCNQQLASGVCLAQERLLVAVLTCAPCQLQVCVRDKIGSMYMEHIGCDTVPRRLFQESKHMLQLKALWATVCQKLMAWCLLSFAMGATTVLKGCNQIGNAWQSAADTSRLRPGVCHGSLSYLAQHIVQQNSRHHLWHAWKGGRWCTIQEHCGVPWHALNLEV